MSYPNLVTDFPASELKGGDTFVSLDWTYAFIVVEPDKLGFTPEAGKVYAWSLVENAGVVLLDTQTVKKVEMVHYTFTD